MLTICFRLLASYWCLSWYSFLCSKKQDVCLMMFSYIWTIIVFTSSKLGLKLLKHDLSSKFPKLVIFHDFLAEICSNGNLVQKYIVWDDSSLLGKLLTVFLLVIITSTIFIVDSYRKFTVLYSEITKLSQAPGGWLTLIFC